MSHLPEVLRKIVVLSGKGGVGKSTMATQMAWSFAARGLRVGVLDLDICGPSVPHLLGLRGRRVGQAEGEKMAPVRVAHDSGLHLDVMSIGFLLGSEQEPVVLRGPRKDGVVKQFLNGVSWGALDVLLVDTPPGTSDEHLSLLSALAPSLSPRDGALVVSTPQAVSLVDVRKELAFCAKQKLHVLGVVENMAQMRLPISALRFYAGGAGGEGGEDVTEHTLATLRARCPELLEGNGGELSVGVDVYPAAEGGAAEMAASFGVPFLGRVPLHASITESSQSGKPSVRPIAAIDEVADKLLAAIDLPAASGALSSDAPSRSTPPPTIHHPAAAAAAAPLTTATCRVPAHTGGASQPHRLIHTRRGGRGLSTVTSVTSVKSVTSVTSGRGLSTAAAVQQRPTVATHHASAALEQIEEAALLHEDAATAAAHQDALIAPLRQLTVFPTTVHIAGLGATIAAETATSVDAINDELTSRALAAYEQCTRSRPDDEIHAPTGLPGGWRTTANMLFFRQQHRHWRDRRGEEHVGPLQRSAAFHSLQRSMRHVATAYLEAHGVPNARSLTSGAPLFCWASVHLGGSTHPPHVHSDAAVTGTYYARRPTSSAPLLLEDPRGRSPFDLVAGLEHRLRYGESAGAGEGALPPFDRTVAVAPRAGECVIFPPWLVHSVPPGPKEDEMLRVSFSFNLLGRWEHTARTA